MLAGWGGCVGIARSEQQNPSNIKKVMRRPPTRQSMRRGHIARRAAPVLLYMSSPSSSIDKLLPALSQLAGDCNISGTLMVPLRAAWEAAWLEQLNEISCLDNESDSLYNDRLDLVALWRESENATDAGLTARTAQARHVTQALMRFWRCATPRNDLLDPRVRAEIEREPMSRAAALVERRRQLQCHAAAGLVEYRIFGEVLSRDVAALHALPYCELVSRESAWRQLGALSNTTGLAAQARRSRAADGDVVGTGVVDAHESVSRWLEEHAILARIDNGTAPWQRWWVLPPVRRTASLLVRCAAAYVQGVREPHTACHGAAAGEAVWVAVGVGAVLRASSASHRVGEEAHESNLFPLLLLLLPVARQGHVEAAAVYVLARTLGGLNAAALAARAGFGAPAHPQREVSRLENHNTEQAILNELVALYDRYFASYSLETYALYALGSLPLVLAAALWWLSSELLTVALELALSSSDPLAF